MTTRSDGADAHEILAIFVGIILLLLYCIKQKQDGEQKSKRSKKTSAPIDNDQPKTAKSVLLTARLPASPGVRTAKSTTSTLMDDQPKTAKSKSPLSTARLPLTSEFRTAQATTPTGDDQPKSNTVLLTSPLPVSEVRTAQANTPVMEIPIGAAQSPSGRRKPMTSQYLGLEMNKGRGSAMLAPTVEAQDDGEELISKPASASKSKTQNK